MSLAHPAQQPLRWSNWAGMSKAGAVISAVVVGIALGLLTPFDTSTPETPSQSGAISHEEFLRLNTEALVYPPPMATASSGAPAIVETPFHYWNVTAFPEVAEGTGANPVTEHFWRWNVDKLEYPVAPFVFKHGEPY